MSDTETLGVKSRKRKSTSRRLSILKGPKSPMRNALGDLDPNSDAVEDVQCRQEFKKSKRLSRRVSFAETYEVKEYLKDADALSMGMWHQRDGSAENVPENETDQAQRAISGDSTQNLSRAEVQHPPQIQGLESLLSGQIKNPVALYNTQDSQENAYYDSKTDVGGNMVEDNKTDSQYLSKDPEAENQSKIDSSMFTKKFISKIDGSMFLKKLMNDGESTSMSTGRGISSYQQSCISQVQEDVPSDDCTVHFKTSENDMDITRCQDTTATLPYTVFPPDTGGLPLSDIKKDQLIDRNDTIEPNMTMEFTQCHGSSLQSDVVPTMQYPSSAEDHTVHFRAAENDMDITRCQDTTASLPNVAFSHGHTLTGNKQVQQFPESAGADTVVSDDHTVHFRAAENDMDLTRCQDTTASLPNVAFSHGHTLTGNKQVQQFPESAGANTVVSDDHTVHFRAAENDMDITRCQDTTGTLPYTEFHSVTNDNTLPGNKTVQQHPDSARDWFPTSTNPCNKSENQQQNLPLKIFNSKNIMAKFDQSLEARLPSQNYSNYSLGSNPEDRRRRFSTGRKFSDQTEPLENVEIEGSTVPEFASDTTLHLDQTMDITLCNSTGILESTNTIMHALDKEIADREFKSSVQVGMEQKQFIADGEKAELDSDGKTRNFTSEDITGCMEMTTCVGSIVSEKPQDISKLQALSRRMRRISNISQDPDKTRVFTFDDDTAAMEFTTCNSYIPIQSSSSGSIAHAKRQDLCPVGPAEQTMIFEEDNGMDMTCATVHVDVPSLITSDRTACNINVASSLHDEHGQAMSMLEDYHMGEPNSSVQAAKDGNSSIDNCHDKTHVFSDDTAAMEMTAVMESTDQIKQSTLSEN
uniref:Uncharacterized protein LOC102801415 n=1 Tax=Saccoglossus kowalevskii TaxID=10224 RepID=A0ABM0MH03_SACKO|nr:PREDICTED: uncharacterized protein LOC102801415 [Saccoglossus kowalevskii]